MRWGREQALLGGPRAGYLVMHEAGWGGRALRREGAAGPLEKTRLILA